MDTIETWCKKRARCWSLSTVFHDTIVFDNWFRHQCMLLSCKQIVKQKQIEVGFTSGHAPITMILADAGGYDSAIWLTYDSDYLCQYVFNELDLVWSCAEYHGYSYIQYDFPLVLQQIAEIQVRVFKRTLPACIVSYIAAFACEVVTYDDVAEEDDTADARGKICMTGGSKRCKRST